MAYLSPVNTNLKKLHKSDRPREKLAKLGGGGLSSSELLAILLGTGYKGKDVMALSNSILNKFSSRNLPKLTYKQLRKVKGIGDAGACRIIAAFELAQRLLLKQEEDLPKINAPEDIYKLVKHIAKFKKENLIGLYLNARNQVIKQETVSIGTLTSSLVHPREVFEPAISNHAASLALVHNHPSGYLVASEEDVEQTKKISAAGKLLGITLIDHVIISNKGFVSLREEGFLSNS